MNDEQLDFCNKNILSIKIGSLLSIGSEQYYLEGNIDKHLDFFEDAGILPDSFLAFKYFGDNAFSNLNFDDEGNYFDILNRITVFEILFKDDGKLLVTDTVNHNVDLWLSESKMTEDLLNLFNPDENVVEIIFEYFVSLYKDDFKFNKKEAYLAVPEIGMF